MAIVSSVIVEDRSQADGRRSITERHTDAQSVIYDIQYLAEQATNATTTMQNRVAILEARLKQREIARAIYDALQDGPAVSPTLNWNTNAEFGLALREFYKKATQRDACRIGWYVSQFNLTDNQLQTFFGLTAGQVTAARNLLTSLSTQYASLLTATGA